MVWQIPRISISSPCPTSHLLISLFGTSQSDVEPMALRGRKQRKEEEVGVFAFEHEIDAEKDGRKDVEEMLIQSGSEPTR